jgi:hypothetical protein
METTFNDFFVLVSLTRLSFLHDKSDNDMFDFLNYQIVYPIYHGACIF